MMYQSIYSYVNFSLYILLNGVKVAYTLMENILRKEQKSSFLKFFFLSGAVELLAIFFSIDHKGYNFANILISMEKAFALHADSHSTC